MFDFSYSVSSPNIEIIESLGRACLLFYIFFFPNMKVVDTKLIILVVCYTTENCLKR